MPYVVVTQQGKARNGPSRGYLSLELVLYGIREPDPVCLDVRLHYRSLDP